MENNEVTIVYFGTPKFAETILSQLIEANLKPQMVVTAPDRPIGRKQELTPPPVKVLAEKNEIPIVQPKKIDEDTTKKLQELTPDLLIVAAYGKILPKNILEIPKYGAINIHPSLLPKYRGPSPIHYAILEGDMITGTTIILMDEKMDHGPIISQAKIKIAENDTTETLSNKLAYHGARLLEETIDPYIKGSLKPEAQNHSAASYTRMINREDGRVDWQNSAQFIERQLRAFTPWPGIFTFWDKKRFKITSLSVLNEDENHNHQEGEVLPYNNVFAIQTGRGKIIPEKVQLEGKKEQPATDFLNGNPNIIESVLK